MTKSKARIGRIALIGALAAGGLVGCSDKPPPYGSEEPLFLPARERQVWAVAPAVNLSGQKEVDPLLHADLLFQQLQQIQGVTVVPVNRVAEVYAGLGLEQVQSAEQAALICEQLGCDALVVPTVTLYDPYSPPKLGASLQLFRRLGGVAKPAALDVRALSRMAAPKPDDPLPKKNDFRQAAGMFDAANGSTRAAALRYAAGRNDPVGPLGAKEYFVSMDRYCGFVYHELADELLRGMRPKVKKNA